MKLSRVILLAITGLSFGVAKSQEALTPVCPRDDAAFAAVQKKAEGKDPEAQSALASCYDLGMHVQPNGKESIRWLTEAANQGYVPAEYELGRIYLYGRLSVPLCRLCRIGVHAESALIQPGRRQDQCLS
jgi:TPR repeat protein